MASPCPASAIASKVLGSRIEPNIGLQSREPADGIEVAAQHEIFVQEQ